jgi:hypothetical protein
MRITSSLLGFSFFGTGTLLVSSAEGVCELATDSVEELDFEKRFLVFGPLLAAF